MYTLLALLACVGVSLAAQCCVPPQWTSQGSFLTAVVRNGKPYYNRGTLLMAYDAVRHRIGHYEHVVLNSGANTLDIGVLLDFQANRKWVINSKTGQCYTMPLNRKLENFIGCVTENATVVGNQDSVGFAPERNDAEHVLNGIFWSARVLEFYCRQLCSGRGHSPGNYRRNDMFIETVHFYNVSVGLPADDPLVVPPRGCEAASNFEGHLHFHAGSSLIGRRSIFNVLGF